MSETVGKAAIDFSSRFGPAPPPGNRLFGGEPLLNCPAVCEIAAYARELGAFPAVKPSVLP